MITYEVAHIGINCADAAEAKSLCKDFFEAFGFAKKNSGASTFMGESIEVIDYNYMGTKGHIGVYTNDIVSAIVELENKGFKIDMETASYIDNCLVAVYLKKEFGGFAVHLLQKSEQK